MEAMVDFLYKGEANLSQENLDGFLALAEEMRLKGLKSKEESNEILNQPKNSQNETFKPELPLRENITKQNVNPIQTQPSPKYLPATSLALNNSFFVLARSQVIY